MALPLPPQVQPLVVAYGSQTGTAIDVAERLAAAAGRRGFIPEVVPLNALSVPELAGKPLVVFVVATTGDGEVPDNMKTFWKAVLQRAIPKSTLAGLSFSVFGLGDSSYVKFNAAARKLQARLLQLGANELHGRGLADDQSRFGLEGDFDAWVSGLWTSLLEKYPVGPEYAVRDCPQLLRTRFAVNVQAEAAAAEGLRFWDPFYHSLRPETAYQGTATVPKDTLLRSMSASGLSFARVVRNQRLSATTWTQDVRHVTLALPSTTCPSYKPGDIAVVHPMNTTDSCAAAVQLAARLRVHLSHTLQLQPRPATGSAAATPESMPARWTTFSDRSAAYTKSPIAADSVPDEASAFSDTTGKGGGGNDVMPTLQPYEVLPRRGKLPALPASCTVGELFTQYLDICGVPRRSFFEQLSFFASDEEQKEKLVEMSTSEGTDLYFEYCTQERRTYVEVLVDFESVGIPLAYLIELIPPLQPRSFSIASAPPAHLETSPRGDSGDADVEVDVCAAVVNYKTKFDRSKQGVCSSWLQGLQTGDIVPVWICPGTMRLPLAPAPDVCPPTVLIGPGTGFAPMRAFIQAVARVQGVPLAPAEMLESYLADGSMHPELAQVGNKNHYEDTSLAEGRGTPRLAVFFGSRKQGGDFLYGRELVHYHQQGVINLLGLAFSRDQQQKEYVQLRLSQAGPTLVEGLAHPASHLFIAGSAKRMPADVTDILTEVIASHAEIPTSVAGQALTAMQRQKRFIVEAWS